MPHHRACAALLSACLLAWALPSLAGQSAQAPKVVASAPPASPEVEGALRDLVQRFYAACAAKDLAALEQVWHPRGPARNGRTGRNMLEVEFELRDIRLTSVALRDVRVDPGGGHGRAIVDLEVTERKTGRTRAERRVREFTFLEDQGTWKIWNEATSAMPLAQRLLGVPAAERPALLAAEPELASDDALNGLGIEAMRLRTQGKAAEALDALLARELLARAVGNEPALASCLLDIGLTYQISGRLIDAAKAFSESRTLFARAGSRTDVAHLDANLASIDYLLGDYAAAAGRYRDALATYEAEGDQARMASTMHGIGNALYLLGDFEGALAAYERTRSLSEGLPQQYGLASAWQALAMVHKELGNYAPAAEAYARSGSISEQTKDFSAAAKAFLGLGDLHRGQGDHLLALESFQRSLAAVERTPDLPNQAAASFAIGQVHAAQRNLPTAVEWYQKALALDEKAEARPGIARDLGGLAGAHLAGGRADLALPEYQRSLELREGLKDEAGAIWTLIHIGVLHATQDRFDEAIRAYMQATGRAERLGDQAALAAALALRGSSELAGGAVEQAIESAGRAVEHAARIEHFDTIAFAKTVAGKALQRAGRAPEAKAALEEAVAASLRIPIGPGVETFFDDRRGPYLALVDLLATQKAAPEAFHWLERSRGQSLALMLGGDGSIVTRGLSDAEREEERTLARELKTAVVRLRRERARTRPDPDRQARLRQEAEAAQGRQDAFRQRLYSAHPDLRALRAQPLDAAAQDMAIAGALGRGETLLAFAVTEERTHVFTVRKPEETAGAAGLAPAALSVAVATIEAKASDLAARVGSFKDAVRNGDPEIATLARELHRQLLEPVESVLAGTKHVVVCPDSFLWGLPFEALRTPTGGYLIERAAVSYAPSAAALAVAATALPPKRSPGPLLALAAPAVSKLAEQRLALLRPGLQLVPPAGTRPETRAAAAPFGAARSTVLRGAQASADRLLQEAAPGAVLHVGAQILLSDASPLHSILVLAPGKEGDDGLVEIGSALGWEVPADLAVFGAVDAGSAGSSGDAMTGLSWAMLVAGTRTVVAGRWQPAPRPAGGAAGAPPASPMLRAFYRAYLNLSAPRAGRLPAAASLQKAARGLIASPATRHPQHWAGFMVLGKGN